MAHGTMDTVVGIQVGRQAYQALKELKYPVSWQQYPMQHGVCMEEIRDISQFIKSVFFNKLL